MTSHLGFLWQAIGSALALAAAAVALASFLRHRRAATILTALACLAHAARTVIFSLANYARLTGLGIMPKDFEEGYVSGIVYIALVAASAIFMFRALWAAAGRRNPARTTIGLVVFYALVLLLAAILAAFPPPSTDAGLNLRLGLLFDYPFVLAKAFLAFACLFVGLRRRKTLAPGRAWALALLILSQVLDFGVRFFLPVDAGLDLAFLAYQASFAAAAFLLPAGQSRESAQAIPAAQTGIEVLRARFRLNDEEAAILGAVIAGSSNKAIAYDRGLSLAVVKRRLFGLYRRLGIGSRFELMALAGRAAAEPVPRGGAGS